MNLKRSDYCDTTDLRDALEAKIQYAADAMAWARDGLKNAPEGHLLVDGAGENARCYWRRQPHEKKGMYLGKCAEETKIALAQKDYETRLLKVASEEKARLEKMLALNEKNMQQLEDGTTVDVVVQVYESLPAARKCLVKPYALNDDEYARRWSQVEYEKNGHSFGAGTYYTRKGLQVRSKSEVIIADSLDAEGVPYRYEQALFIGGYSPVYTDFTVLNKRTRVEYIWEHLGALDDQDYCTSALQKLNQYALAGYLPGERLLLTQESSAVPLDTRVVLALIERFLK